MRAMVLASALGALTVAALALPSPAQADFRVCNKTSRPVDVAVGWIDPHGNGFTSQGWWTLQPGGHCETLVLNSETSDPNNYFYYAEKQGGGRWSGDTTLCTRQQAFLISGPAGGGWCGNAGFDARNFKHVHSPSGNQTTNLTERGGGQIIDEG